MATCLGCSGSSGIWNSDFPQDATNKLLELRKSVKGHLTEVDSGSGEGRLEGGAHHPGSGSGTTHGYRPKIRTLRRENPQAQAPPGEAVPCGPYRKPTAPAAGPGRHLLALQPCFSSCGLRFKTTLPISSSPRNSVPLRVLPTRPRFCHSLLGPDGNSPLLPNKPTFAGNITGGVISKGNGRIKRGHSQDRRSAHKHHVHVCTLLTTRRKEKVRDGPIYNRSRRNDVPQRKSKQGGGRPAVPGQGTGDRNGGRRTGAESCSVLLAAEEPTL